MGGRGWDRRGSVSVIGALLLPMLIGMSGLVIDYGHGVLVKAQNQRVADLAAFAGALAYNASGSASAMSAAVDTVAALNGLPAADVTGALVPSPSGDGAQAIEVAIDDTIPVFLAQVVTGDTQMQVAVVSYAELNAKTQGCVIALSASGSGVTLGAGTGISASGCTVASNDSVEVPCGATITAPEVNYDGAAPSQPCGGITAPGGSVKLDKILTADPLAGNPGVTSATARLAAVAGMSSPAPPATPAGITDLQFGWSPSTTTAEAAELGCTAAFANSTWTLTCPAGATVDVASLTIGGGINLDFNTAGSAATTYNFSGAVTLTGTTNFGPGTYNIAKGLTTGGGAVASFAAGTFTIGQSASGCNGAARYSICNTGSSLSFGGPSRFELGAGVYNSGGAILALGSGATNSYAIGSSSDGNAFWAGGGSKASFADATGAGDLFELIGNLDIASGGGSCLALPAASEHDIDGDFLTAGGTLLGAGVYTVHGFIALGGNGGGDVSCWGSTLGISGAGVTIVADGSTTPVSGGCAGLAFCVAAGYGHVGLTAPQSGATAQILAIGPTGTGVTAGASFAEGSGATDLSGAFYFPQGAVSLSGAATLASGPGECLELIGSQVSLNGGSAVALACVSTNIASVGAILVQ